MQHATPADVQAATGEAAGVLKPKDGSAAAKGTEAAEGALSLEAFNLERVLQMGTPLLASGGQVYYLECLDLLRLYIFSTFNYLVASPCGMVAHAPWLPEMHGC